MSLCKVEREMAATAEITIDSESDDSEDTQERIITLLKEHPKGIDNSLLEVKLSHCTITQRVRALNALLAAKRVHLFKTIVGDERKLLYRLRETPVVSRANIKGDQEEKWLYRIIADAGSKGASTADIRLKMNLQLAPVNKLLKNLEKKQLIKGVVPLGSVRKKVYMLIEHEADRSVSGGILFRNSVEFDEELVQMLQSLCIKYLKEKVVNARVQFVDTELLLQHSAELACAKEIHQHIVEQSVCKVKITTTDVEDVLQTLVYEGKVEKRNGMLGVEGEWQQVYRLVRPPMMKVTGITQFPCGHCKLIGECRESGPISPANCSYLKQWMDF